MNRGKQIAAPKGQEHEDEAADRAEGKTTAALSELPAHNEQAEVKQPDDRGPKYFGIAAMGARMVESSQVIGAKRQADSQQNESGQEQAANNGFEPLNRRQQGENCLQFAKLEVVLLSEVH